MAFCVGEDQCRTPRASVQHPALDLEVLLARRSSKLAFHGGAWVFPGGRIDPDDYAGARRFLEAFPAHLADACIGTISEVFDADEPFTPRGCVAQAWSVAEVLRSWAKTEK